MGTEKTEKEHQVTSHDSDQEGFLVPTDTSELNVGFEVAEYHDQDLLKPLVAKLKQETSLLCRELEKRAAMCVELKDANTRLMDELKNMCEPCLIQILEAKNNWVVRNRLMSKLMEKFGARHTQTHMYIFLFLFFQSIMRIAEAKLTKDYETVRKDFQKAQLQAAEKEKSFAPRLADSTHYPRREVGWIMQHGLERDKINSILKLWSREEDCSGSFIQCIAS